MRRSHSPNLPAHVIEWFSQLGGDARLGLGDCLIAVDRILAGWALPRSATINLVVDDMTRRLMRLFPGKYADGFLWTWIDDSVVLLRSYGVKSETFAQVSLAQLTEWVNQAPVLVLVNYILLPERVKYDKKYENAHAIGVTKIDKTHVHYLDPYARTEAQGTKKITIAEFMRAWDNARFYTYPRQGLRLL